MKASGLAGAAKRISEAVGESIQSYERGIRIFKLGIIVGALIVQTNQCGCPVPGWLFQKSVDLIC